MKVGVSARHGLRRQRAGGCHHPVAISTPCARACQSPQTHADVASPEIAPAEHSRARRPFPARHSIAPPPTMPPTLLSTVSRALRSRGAPGSFARGLTATATLRAPQPQPASGPRADAASSGETPFASGAPTAQKPHDKSPSAAQWDPSAIDHGLFEGGCAPCRDAPAVRVARALARPRAARALVAERASRMPPVSAWPLGVAVTLTLARSPAGGLSATGEDVEQVLQTADEAYARLYDELHEESGMYADTFITDPEVLALARAAGDVAAPYQSAREEVRRFKGGAPQGSDSMNAPQDSPVAVEASRLQVSVPPRDPSSPEGGSPPNRMPRVDCQARASPSLHRARVDFPLQQGHESFMSRPSEAAAADAGAAPTKAVYGRAAREAMGSTASAAPSAKPRREPPPAATTGASGAVGPGPAINEDHLRAKGYPTAPAEPQAQRGWQDDKIGTAGADVKGVGSRTPGE